MIDTAIAKMGDFIGEYLCKCGAILIKALTRDLGCRKVVV
jgi:hypothetical protein